MQQFTIKVGESMNRGRLHCLTHESLYRLSTINSDLFPPGFIIINGYFDIKLKNVNFQPRSNDRWHFNSPPINQSRQFSSPMILRHPNKIVLSNLSDEVEKKI